MTISVLLFVLWSVFCGLLGSFVAVLYTYWQLATGRRTIRPWNNFL